MSRPFLRAPAALPSLPPVYRSHPTAKGPRHRHRAAGPPDQPLPPRRRLSPAATARRRPRPPGPGSAELPAGSALPILNGFHTAASLSPGGGLAFPPLSSEPARGRGRCRRLLDGARPQLPAADGLLAAAAR